MWQILVEISNRYQAHLNEYFHGDQSKVRDLAVIWGGEVRMANLCVCACFAVNGVSALHSDILKRETFHDVYVQTPEKFKNVTNGIDHRRWLSEINPKLDALIRECAGGDAYLLQPEKLVQLERYKAVSYTHLDVYKRQVYPLPRQRTVHRDHPAPHERGHLPVSYTHLDVYNRQGPAPASSGEAPH